MRLRYVEYVSPQDRQKLRMKAGDVVLYGGVKHTIVGAPGMKYAHIAPLSNPTAIGFAKLQELTKWFDAGPGEEDPFEIPR